MGTFAIGQQKVYNVTCFNKFCSGMNLIIALLSICPTFSNYGSRDNGNVVVVDMNPRCVLESRNGLGV